MIFTKSTLPGVFIIEPERHEDARGFFARAWCQREFETHGLNLRLVQCNISFNKKKGTLRGIHYQTAPCEEAKLVRCTRGSIYYLIIDLRPNSPAFKKYSVNILNADNRKMVYVPEGCAHGFITLEDGTEIFYHISEFYSAEHAKGIRWNDPAFNLSWPLEPIVMSDRDRNFADFSEQRVNVP